MKSFNQLAGKWYYSQILLVEAIKLIAEALGIAENRKNVISPAIY